MFDIKTKNLLILILLIYAVVLAENVKDLYGMKKITIGVFEMGAQEGYQFWKVALDEIPVHSVKVNCFWIDSTEVTQKEYERLIGNNPSKFIGENRPVEQVTWWDAIKYCNARSKEAGLQPIYDESTGECDFNKKGFRLPTEAEWEFAYRGNSDDPYFWGKSQKPSLMNGSSHSYREGAKYANYDDPDKNDHDGYNEETAPVASYLPNQNGLYDMSGNVWEWCNDWYNRDYYKTSPSDNPKGPLYGDNRVRRGGSWMDSYQYVQGWRRQGWLPDEHTSILGFRCVLPDLQ